MAFCISANKTLACKLFYIQFIVSQYLSKIYKKLITCAYKKDIININYISKLSTI